jgi:8-oxo-dGTP diphosphatase
MPLPKMGVTADVAWFHIKLNEYMNTSEVYFLTVKRKNEPYRYCHALPGGFVELNETLKQGARRELFEETHGNIDMKRLHFVMMLDGVKRDPRGRTISAVFTTMTFGGWNDTFSFPELEAGDDASDLKWMKLDNTNLLAFDHHLAVEQAFAKASEIFKIPQGAIV